MNKRKKIVNKLSLWLLIFGNAVMFTAKVCLALTPLWMWIANGHSIYGGIDDTPLSFGISFIGTFLACCGAGL